MGIPERKVREKERRRMQILVAAKSVFVSKGFGHTTMEDIASEAELSAGTLYLYFKNKNELYASLTLRVLQYLILRLDQLHRDHKGNHIEKIRHIKHVLIDVYEFDPLILRSLFVLQSSDLLKHLSEELVAEIADLGKKAIQSIAGIFEHAVEEGICLDLHPLAIADVLWSLFSGVAILEFSRRDIDDSRDRFKSRMETAFEIFINGIMIQETQPA